VLRLQAADKAKESEVQGEAKGKEKNSRNEPAASRFVFTFIEDGKHKD
jgi:hypothetical protein